MNLVNIAIFSSGTMSSKVMFQIVHGEGNLRFGPDGVDLSDFVMTSVTP